MSFESKNRLLILYFSGVANTREIAQFMAEYLLSSQVSSQLADTISEITTDIYSIENLPLDLDFNSYQAIILGSPTIHCAPAKPLLDFLDALSPLKSPIPAFLFVTCGLYSANTLRILAKECLTKNIIPVLSKSYRCPATDGILLAPNMPSWFCHEKALLKKIQADLTYFITLCQSPKAKIPRLKFYSLFNYPNKLLGQKLSFPIYIQHEKCSKCLKCIQNCPTKSLAQDPNYYPKWQKYACIHCYRCIHHCPNLALSLNSKRSPAKTFITAKCSLRSDKPNTKQ